MDQLVRLEIKGLLDQDSPLGGSLCCVLEQDTLYMLFSTVLTLILPRKTGNCPNMTEEMLTGQKAKKN